MAVAALVALAIVLVALVQAGRREKSAEQTRLSEQTRTDARRTMDAVWKMNDREFEEFVAGLCHREAAPTRADRREE